ncbi:hypothetical protein Vafri_5903 [Volvox africanus]|nr:hypothetical protein Vafri_5903 [Volvox africanus]
MVKEKLDDPLDLHNYATWKIRFEALCEDLGLGNALLAEPHTDEDVSRSGKVMGLLIKNVKDRHLQSVTNAANAKAAWDTLAGVFAAINHSRGLALRQELRLLRMANGEELTKYIARARRLQSDMLGAGQAFSELELSSAFLAGLPKKFKTFKTALLMTHDGELDLATVSAKLLTYASLVGDYENFEWTGFGAVGSLAFGSGSSGRIADEGNASSQRTNIICHYCKKPGHYIRDCRRRIADRQADRGVSGSNKSGSSGDGRRNSYSQAPHHKAFAGTDNSSRPLDWHLDSGSMWHVTYDESDLEDVRQLSPDKQLRVRGQVFKPTAVGNLRLHSNVVDGLELTFYDVYVAPESFMKILSVGRFDTRGAEISFGGGKATVRHLGKTILSAARVDNLYAIKY